MKPYPKVKSVRPLDNYRLLVGFTNDVVKIYDCAVLLADPVFSSLRNKTWFRSVHVDKGGYGISWNDEIDLSESELWTYGKIAEGIVH